VARRGRDDHPAEIRALEALYVEAMDELLAKDLSFFQTTTPGR
jgi:hypothetical protein